MVSLSVAWVLVTIIKQKDVNEFEFSPLIFVITGLIDLAIVSVAIKAFAG